MEAQGHAAQAARGDEPGVERAQQPQRVGADERLQRGVAGAREQVGDGDDHVGGV